MASTAFAKEEGAIDAVIDLALRLASERIVVTEAEIAQLEASNSQLSPERKARIQACVENVKRRIASKEEDKANSPPLDLDELLVRLQGEPTMN
jgi:hypothetical protein